MSRARARRRAARALAASSSSGGASLPRRAGERDLRPQSFDAAHVGARRAGPVSAVASSCVAASGAAGVELRLRGGERARPAPSRVGRELGRPLQERGRRGQRRRGSGPGRPNARARPPLPRPAPSRPGRDATLGVRGRSRDRSPPRAPGVPSRRSAAVADRYDGRAHQRMAEAHLRVELDQPRRLGRRRRIRSDPELLGRAPQQRRVAGRLGRGGQSKRCVSAGSGCSRRRKFCSMRLASGRASGRPNPPASSAGGQSPRQLQQRERVPPRLGDDPVAHPLVEPPRNDRVQQRAGIARRADPVPRAPADPPSASSSVGSRTREDHRNRLREQRAARRTRVPARTRGRATAHRRPRRASGCSLRHLGQQAEHGETDEETIRRLRRQRGRTRCSTRRAADPGRRSRSLSTGAHS